MIDPTQLATDATTLLAPLLPLVSSLAGKLTDGFLSEPGAKLFDWLSAQFHGKPAQIPLDRALAEPQNQNRLDALRLEILDAAEKDPEFLNQLASLVNTATQTTSVTGDNNKIAQACGKDINVQIS